MDHKLILDRHDDSKIGDALFSMFRVKIAQSELTSEPKEVAHLETFELKVFATSTTISYTGIPVVMQSYLGARGFHAISNGSSGDLYVEGVLR